MGKKCKYYREDKLATYTPECCVEDGFTFNDVHPYDVERYCRFCGKKIKLKEYTSHPDVYEDD